ncbi:MAG: PDZ domain-containing protein, partial [Planctomycetes bacterium]|nr:PDZ domain-containing protein [Planctomycetota bacterium]
YSRYIPPSSVADYDESSSGSYQGIGALIVPQGDEVVVHFPFPDSPAERAGLQPGDVVVAVDGTPLDDEQARRDVAQLVRGEAGTDVRLTIRRGDEQLEVDVERRSVQTSCVHWTRLVDAERGLGYAYLADFHPTASAQLFDAIRSLEREAAAAGGALRGLILDLRFDGGGSLDQCLAIARGFLTDGVITTQKRRKGADIVYEARPAEVKWPDLPLVLLVNGSSASASEVLAGALQDHQRAVVVGERTYGKGYVNTVYSWRNRDFKLKLTTGSYRTPSGRNIERNHATHATPADQEQGGIVPDVKIELTPEDRARLRLALHRTEVPKAYRAAYDRAAARFGFETTEPLGVDDDPQLRAAVEALRERAR